MIFCSILICFGVGWTHSIGSISDSIVSYLRPSFDTTSITVLDNFVRNLTIVYRFAQADSILRQTEQAARLFNYSFGFELAYFIKGQMNYFQDKYEWALFSLTKALRIVEHTGTPTKKQQALHSLIDLTHYCLYPYEISLPFF